MNTFFGISFNAYPHPDPLPQERGKRTPSLCIARASRSLFTFRFDEAKRGDRPIDSRKLRGIRSLFPLPGGEGQGEGGRNH
jgi:hypothetical protein